MIEINDKLFLDDDEIRFSFVRSSGPGGQNVNKVATAVQLRFDAAVSRNLSEETKNRLRFLAGRRMTKDGVLVIEARRHRSQEQNRQDAMERLIILIRKALVRPVIRKTTKPRRSALEKRLKRKRERSDKKRTRQPIRDLSGD